MPPRPVAWPKNRIASRRFAATTAAGESATRRLQQTDRVNVNDESRRVPFPRRGELPKPVQHRVEPLAAGRLQQQLVPELILEPWNRRFRRPEHAQLFRRGHQVNAEL